MRTISIKLSRTFDEIIIVPFADEHDGDSVANEELTDKKIKFVEQTPNAFAILNGDISNMATKSGKSDVYGAKYTPQEQLERAKRKYSAMAGMNKILFIVPGNHEDRTYKESGIDVMASLALMLGLEDRYSPDGAYLFLRVGETLGKKESNGSGKYRQICYTIYANHNHGGGKKEGSKINALMGLGDLVTADIYIGSHTHLPAIIPSKYSEIDYRNDKILDKDSLFINTGSALERGGYGEKFGYKPLSNRTPFIYLNGRKKYFDADLGRGCGFEG